MPTDAKENLVLTTLLTALAGIAGVAYLTSPTVIEGPPADSIEASACPLVSVHFARTEILGAETGSATHKWRLHYAIWCHHTTRRGVAQIKADVMRVIFAAEAVFTGAYGQPMWAGDFNMRDDMYRSGVVSGGVLAYLDLEADHASP